MPGESQLKNEDKEETTNEEQQKKLTEQHEQQQEQKYFDFSRKQKSRRQWQRSHGRRTSWSQANSLRLT